MLLLAFSALKHKLISNVLLHLWQALFGMSGAWLVCFLLTFFDALPTSPHEYGHQARTDINLDAVSSAEWFFMPYPGGNCSNILPCDRILMLMNRRHKITLISGILIHFKL